MGAELFQMQAEQPTAKPSAIPKVMGVLSIVFSSLVLLWSLAALAGSCGGSAMVNGIEINADTPGVSQAFIDSWAASYASYQYYGLCFLIGSVWLLVVGIGQVKYRHWACAGSVTWGLGALVLLGIAVLILIALIGPAYGEMMVAMQDLQPDAPFRFGRGMGQVATTMMAVLTVVIYLPYPIVMIVLFRKDNVRESMRF
jgi:hypothetical protein